MKKKVIFLLSVTLSLFSLLNFGVLGKTDFSRQREEMIKFQIEARGIKDKKVLAAMKKVKRHLFVPSGLRNFAYYDQALPVGQGQTISQPYVVALMTELLLLKGDERVLEIGTGSGYQAAILAEIAGEVYTIEILPVLAQSSERLLNQLGYKNIKVRCGDGYQGWPEQAPFDAIIVTCAPPNIPQALIDQLADGGRLVIPLSEEVQELKVLIKKKNKIEIEDIIPVRFVPMVKGYEKR